MELSKQNKFDKMKMSTKGRESLMTQSGRLELTQNNGQQHMPAYCSEHTGQYNLT